MKNRNKQYSAKISQVRLYWTIRGNINVIHKTIKITNWCNFNKHNIISVSYIEENAIKMRQQNTIIDAAKH